MLCFILSVNPARPHKLKLNRGDIKATQGKFAQQTCAKKEHHPNGWCSFLARLPGLEPGASDLGVGPAGSALLATFGLKPLLFLTFFKFLCLLFVTIFC